MDFLTSPLGLGIIGFLFFWLLIKYLTRNKCTKCKSTNFSEIERQLSKSYIKKRKVGREAEQLTFDEKYNGTIPRHYDVYATDQHFEYIVTYKCNDCGNIWRKKVKEVETI